MSNSITEGWGNPHPDFFTDKGYIRLGISKQTSSQFLVRFRSGGIKVILTTTLPTASFGRRVYILLYFLDY
ncbi:hypothetical protein [Bacteroides sp. AN502(2024)]|uniref:hypothetical protein n=1 Tax=Bacteroides sp. AN502(2024) TaxID=3160599 RepID=UPI003511AA93